MKRSNYNCRQSKDNTAKAAMRNCDNGYSMSEEEFNRRNARLKKLMAEMQEFVGSEYTLTELTFFDERTHQYVTRKF